MDMVEKEGFCVLYSQWNMYFGSLKRRFISISGGTKRLSGMTEQLKRKYPAGRTAFFDLSHQFLRITHSNIITKGKNLGLT